LKQIILFIFSDLTEQHITSFY